MIFCPGGIAAFGNQIDSMSSGHIFYFALNFSAVMEKFNGTNLFCFIVRNIFLMGNHVSLENASISMVPMTE